MSRLKAGAVPPGAVVVVGGDGVVGHALELLLRGVGYEARFEALPAFYETGSLEKAWLLLLAPGLDECEREMLLAFVEAARDAGGPPVLELVPAATSRFRQGHVMVPWPCRPEDLQREIETVLLTRDAGKASYGEFDPSEEKWERA